MGRASELVEALVDREVDVACIQETRWRGSGCRFLELKARGISCSGWEVRIDLMG